MMLSPSMALCSNKVECCFTMSVFSCCHCCSSIKPASVPSTCHHQQMHCANPFLLYFHKSLLLLLVLSQELCLCCCNAGTQSCCPHLQGASQCLLFVLAF